MALLEREREDNGRSDTGSVDRRLLAVALALAVLTLLAVLDLTRPVPGADRPVEVRIPPVDLPFATAPSAKPRRIETDDLLVHD